MAAEHARSAHCGTAAGALCDPVPLDPKAGSIFQRVAWRLSCGPWPAPPSRAGLDEGLQLGALEPAVLSMPCSTMARQSIRDTEARKRGKSWGGGRFFSCPDAGRFDSHVRRQGF